MKIRLYILLFIGCLSLFGMSSCTGVREAQVTVAQADSLLQTGEVCTDSAALAQAARALAPWQWAMPDDYARACFFLGRLLRIGEYYSEAMPYLIKACHAGSDDHVLNGRTYSNIAYICRLEGNYPLAYTMYKQSTEEFLQGGDTTRHLIGLTNMAYALAEQGDTAGVRTLLESVGQAAPSPAIMAMCCETYAEAYLRAGDYPQSLYYADQATDLQGETPSVIMIQAQCHSRLGQYEQAAARARQVVQSTDHLFLLANALHILTQQDPTAGLDDVRFNASMRALVLKQLVDNQGDLTRAVDMLQQDLDTQPRKWGMLIVAMLCLVIAMIAWWRIIRVQHKRSIATIAHEKQQAQEFISAKREQNAQLQLQFSERRRKIEQEVTQNITSLINAGDWRNTLCWNDYDQLCEVVNKQFFLLADKLKVQGALSEKEVRLCVLVLMDCFSSKQLATLLHYGESGIRNYKQHTANKLGTTSRELREHLIRIMTGEA